ncbi:hypothetical protein NRB16_21955 [Pseudomonas sp. LJDD11]|uniref:hypothetical protein n=1 Tax=unclassified Pseudomonas TaxID=196821 RepID=UPI0004F6DD55|nr:MULTISPECIES: hypothetical protein [unclassified Pseudomonas]MCQ9426188.1 hypothetical protein [Pseudomonas sp. LJDD11]BAP41551.1 putative DNA-binding protein [Pseudomonas sp. StFLB209]
MILDTRLRMIRHWSGNWKKPVIHPRPERRGWSRPDGQDIHGPCQSSRRLPMNTFGDIPLEHTTLTIDADRHLRLVYYTPGENCSTKIEFEQWLASPQL